MNFRLDQRDGSGLQLLELGGSTRLSVSFAAGEDEGEVLRVQELACDRMARALSASAKGDGRRWLKARLEEAEVQRQFDASAERERQLEREASWFRRTADSESYKLFTKVQEETRGLRQRLATARAETAKLSASGLWDEQRRQGDNLRAMAHRQAETALSAATVTSALAGALLAIRATALDPACLLGEALALVDGPGYSRVTTGLPWQAASISLGHLPQGWLVSLTFTGASGALAQLHPVAGARMASLVAAALRRPGVDLDAIRQLHDRRAEIGATRQRVQQAEGIVAGFEAQARVVAAGWVQLDRKS